VYRLRCTRLLLRDVRGLLPDASSTDTTTTKLGDWFATRLNVAAQRYVIVTSARSLLTVVTPARDLARLPERVAVATDRLLGNIGVSDARRKRELAAMREAVIDRTNDRSIVASMNALSQRAYQELWDMPHRPGRTLDHINVSLACTPLGAHGHRTATEVVLELMR
jgi:hypothetical protein